MLAINETKLRYAEHNRAVDAYLLEREALKAKGAKAGDIVQVYEQALSWLGGKLVLVGQSLQHHAMARLHEPA